MTNLRLARPTRVVRDHVEWHRHARIGFFIRSFGHETAHNRRALCKPLRRWYMLGRECV